MINFRKSGRRPTLRMEFVLSNKFRTLWITGPRLKATRQHRRARALELSTSVQLVKHHEQRPVAVLDAQAFCRAVPVGVS